MFTQLLPISFLSFLAAQALGQEFTIYDGQIFTPGFAVLDSPQPWTPMGGDTIEIALDVTADGVLPLDVTTDSPSRINNITIFMYSYDTGRNFTVSNGTATANSASLGEIMLQEPSSTVKHVKWSWPACLVGDGPPAAGSGSDRGNYNISIRQNFVMNSTNYYTTFDLPISVTNRIEESTGRADCDSLNNPMLTPDEVNATAANRVGVLFSPGNSQVVKMKLNRTDEGGQGLGGAGILTWRSGAEWLCAITLVFAFVL
ncbi:hypothetical protein VSDG_02057 [Cytospora chrysosperma]|uniref:Uncharacterized protein n=1 Tax=Cytospora chrysosperma TaxID=252740 RepID=A0A423WE16_CYTCH|nr:hypothetical protein VSDG_02057 [Valsa sordida]